jgi:hypothetical protein
MTYTEQQRRQIIEQMKGQRIADIEWSAEPDGSGGYWVLTLEDGTEACFRFMSELTDK